MCISLIGITNQIFYFFSQVWVVLLAELVSKFKKNIISILFILIFIKYFYAYYIFPRVNMKAESNSICESTLQILW